MTLDFLGWLDDFVYCPVFDLVFPKHTSKLAVGFTDDEQHVAHDAPRGPVRASVVRVTVTNVGVHRVKGCAVSLLGIEGPEPADAPMAMPGGAVLPWADGEKEPFAYRELGIGESRLADVCRIDWEEERIHPATAGWPTKYDAILPARGVTAFHVRAGAANAPNVRSVVRVDCSAGAGGLDVAFEPVG